MMIQGLPISWLDVMRSGYQGMFANLLLPGSLGLDGIRFLHVRRSYEDKLAEGLAAIAIDRIIGLVGMLVLGSLASICFWAVGDDPRIISVAIVTTGSTIILIGALGLVCGVIPGPLLSWAHRFEFISELAASFSLYRNHVGTLVISLLISVLAHCLACFAWYLGLTVLGYESPMLAVFMLAPILLVLTSLPITPLGIGVADGAAEFLFGMVGLSAGAELQMFIRAMIVIVLIVSGVSYFWRHK